MLSYYKDKGVLERSARGVYRNLHNEGDFNDVRWEELAIVASSIKNSIICLISALNYYELTDELMREYWLAVPHSNSHVKSPNARIIRMRNVSLGVKTILLASMKVKIFDEERTILDTFRLLDEETGLKALKNYMMKRDHRPNIKKIGQYSKILKVDISKYMAPFLV